MTIAKSLQSEAPFTPDAILAEGRLNPTRKTCLTVLLNNLSHQLYSICTQASGRLGSGLDGIKCRRRNGPTCRSQADQAVGSFRTDKFEEEEEGMSSIKNEQRKDEKKTMRGVPIRNNGAYLSLSRLAAEGVTSDERPRECCLLTTKSQCHPRAVKGLSPVTMTTPVLVLSSQCRQSSSMSSINSP